MLHPRSDKRTKEKWIQLPYLGQPSHCLANELRHFNYKIGFYPFSTLGALSNLKDHPIQEDKSGICGECNSFYIGQTGRSQESRFREHKTRTTAVSSHFLAAGHDPNKLSITLLHSISKGKVMNALEEAETVRSIRDNQLNDLRATFLHHFTRLYYNFQS